MTLWSRSCATACFLGLVLGCAGWEPERDCTTDGGAIKRGPREVTAGDKTVVVSEKYCMNFNDEGFEKSTISVHDPGATNWRDYDRIVPCHDIWIDRLFVNEADNVEFWSADIPVPLVYDAARDTFENSGAWACDF